MKAAPKADDSSPLRCIPGSYFNTSLTIYYNLGILIEPPIISFLVIYSNLILNLVLISFMNYSNNSLN